MSQTTEPILPTSKVMTHACKLACSNDKPIMMDYWLDSHDGKVMIGVREDGDKMLVRSEQEYTSPIAKMFKVGEEVIVMTENSIYIISAKIPTKKIS